MIVFKNKVTSPLVVPFDGAQDKIHLKAAYRTMPNYDPSIRSLHSHSGRAGSRNGFTLIEVLLAMAIIGLVLTPIFNGQSAISRSVSRARRAFGGILAAKKFLIDTEFNLAPEAQTFTTSKKSDEGITLKYELKKIPDSSALKKFKNVLIQSVTIQAPQTQSKKQERLVSFIYKPESSSEKSGV